MCLCIRIVLARINCVVKQRWILWITSRWQVFTSEIIWGNANIDSQFFLTVILCIVASSQISEALFLIFFLKRFCTMATLIEEFKEGNGYRV
jgi:hypothetical protein